VVGEDDRVGDLVAVQVQDRQHSTISARVDELVGVPRGRERSGLCLTVADDTGNHQIGIVQYSAVRVAEGVSELAALVDRAGQLRCHMARTTGEGELAEQVVHPVLVARYIRIGLTVAAPEPSIGRDRGATMSGADHVHHVQIAPADHPVHVDIKHVQTRRGAPMPQQAWLDVLARSGSARRALLSK
jgi:hypothetical protein